MKKAFTIISLVASLAIVAVLAIVFLPPLLNTSTSSYPTLKAPTNLSYDDETYILSWDIVENADSYNVSINDDDELVVEDNKVFYVPINQTSEFKIKALDSTGEYQSSKWSNSLTYTIKENEISYASVSAFVSTMLPGDYNLKKLVNISIDSNENMVYTNAVFERDSELKVYELNTAYNTEINSLKDAIEIKNAGTRILHYYDIANYDSANSLLKSNSYVGQMEELRQQGYTFEVVSQQVGKTYVDNSVFNIYATYKLTNGDEVKYVNSMITAVIESLSYIEKTNYTTRVENPEDRILYEKYFKILTDDEIDLAKDIEAANIPLVFDFTSSSN